MYTGDYSAVIFQDNSISTFIDNRAGSSGGVIYNYINTSSIKFEGDCK